MKIKWLRIGVGMLLVTLSGFIFAVIGVYFNIPQALLSPLALVLGMVVMLLYMSAVDCFE